MIQLAVAANVCLSVCLLWDCLIQRCSEFTLRVKNCPGTDWESRDLTQNCRLEISLGKLQVFISDEVLLVKQ